MRQFRWSCGQKKSWLKRKAWKESIINFKSWLSIVWGIWTGHSPFDFSCGFYHVDNFRFVWGDESKSGVTKNKYFLMQNFIVCGNLLGFHWMRAERRLNSMFSFENGPSFEELKSGIGVWCTSPATYLLFGLCYSQPLICKCLNLKIADEFRKKIQFNKNECKVNVTLRAFLLLLFIVHHV